MNILLAGEGGQGVQSIAKIIARAAQKAGKHETYLPGFGVEQRGGVSLAFLKINNENIFYPRFAKADIIISLCNRSMATIKEYLKDSSIFIYDNSAINDEHLDEIRALVKKFLKIPAQQMAIEKFTIKSANMILLGAVLPSLGIDQSAIEDQIREEFKDKMAKNPQITDQNLSAFRQGLELVKAPMEDFSGKAEVEIKSQFSDDKKIWKCFPEYCKGCGLCVARCPVHAIHFTKNQGFLGTPLPEVDINKCEACDTCEKICPDGAIKVEKYSSQQVE